MTDHRLLFGPDGEPCGSCGAALAADQRYCLACGHRRADARLPFRDILGEGTGTELRPLGPGYTVMPRGGGPTVNDRLRRNAPLMALVGILLIALLIGVLLGHWAGDTPTVAQAAPRPQVIQVGAAAPAAAAPAPTTTEAVAPPDDATGDGGGDAPKGKTSSSGSGASNNDVKKLSTLSGKDYQKQVDKLGKTISTGGKAPPKDSKAPAAGGSFEDIG
jgi:hypothetical protein